MKNRDVFNFIYKFNLWGWGSGTGSIPHLNREYINFLNEYISKNDFKTILDIGCGDWQIGSKINWGDAKYIGVDVSDYILEKTKKKYSAPNREFRVLDAVNEQLPKADLVIIREVLQHLSNESVEKVLKKLAAHPNVLVINSFLEGHEGNGDTFDGGYRSLNITLEPFNRKLFGLKYVYSNPIGKLLPFLKYKIGIWLSNKSSLYVNEK